MKDIEKQGDLDYIYNIISYLFEAGEISNQDEFVETLKKGLTINEEKVMTLAERYRAEGEARGRAEVLRKMTMKMLEKGMSPKEIAQLTDISDEELRILIAKVKEKYR